jgi:DNA-binding response OmpR family regulator
MRWSTGIILFVDGDHEVPRTVTEALGVSEYIVLHAATAQEAESVLSRLNFIIDLLVIDLELPDETGRGVFGLLTGAGCRKASTIIAKTYRQEKRFLGDVYSLGVDTILLKPTSAEQLVQSVQAALSGCPTWFG